MALGARSIFLTGNLSQEELLSSAMEGGCEKKIYTVAKAHVIQNPNYGCEDVYPVELSMAAFSLQRGVVETYTTLIDPGTLPSGSAFKAKVFAEETGLPRPGIDAKSFSAANRDYKAITTNVRNFIYKFLSLQTGRLPRKIVFVMATDVKEVSGAIKWLVGRCGDEGLKKQLGNLDFVDFSKLYFRLGLFTNKTKPYYMSPMVQFQMAGLAEKQLNNTDIYSFKFEITCPYHCHVASDKMDICAKNYILRRVFLIIEEFVNVLGFEKVDGHSLYTYSKK